MSRDVSAENVGYDIESFVPEEMRNAEDATMRFIEVKGRAKSSESVTVSKNEILTALNKPDQYILAIVEVDGAYRHTIYLKKPFKQTPDFAATSVNYDIKDLLKNAEIVLER